MNKKAQLFGFSETFKTLAGVGLMGIFVIFMGYMLWQFRTQMMSKEMFQNSIFDGVFSFMQSYPVFMDWVTLVVFGILFAFSIYACSRIEVGSALYIMSMIGLFIFGFSFWVVGYVFNQFVTQSVFAEVVATMIFIPFFAANAFLVAIFYCFICLMILHAPTQ